MKLKPILLPISKAHCKNSKSRVSKKLGKLINKNIPINVESNTDYNMKDYHLILVDIMSQVKDCGTIIYAKFDGGQIGTYVFDLENVTHDLRTELGTYPFINSDHFNVVIASANNIGEIPCLSDNAINNLLKHYNKHGKLPNSVDVEFSNFNCSSLNKRDIARNNSYGIRINSDGKVDVTITDALNSSHIDHTLMLLKQCLQKH